MQPKNSKKWIQSIVILPILFTLILSSSLGWAKNPPTKLSNIKTFEILVSIKPLYSLAAGLTKNIPGVSTELLLTPPNSPHTFHLKPSDVKKIEKADLIVWVGPELENFLITPLKNLKPKSQILSLMQDGNLELLALRQGGNWEDHDHGHDHDHAHQHGHGIIDPHIWLNIKNAKLITLALSKKLQRLDPKHAATYVNNQKNQIKKLDLLKNKMTENLKLVKNKPFLVFHDAYHYFEEEFGLRAVGSVTVNPQIPLSAKRLHEIQTSIKRHQIQCIFSEPEFSQNLVKKLLSNTSVKNLELDPLGARIIVPKGQEDDVYFELMMGLSNLFKTCLVS